MFWDRYIPAKFLTRPEVCALEVCNRDAGKVFYYTHLRSKNKSLEIVACGSCEDKLILPAIVLKNKIPLVIIINGKGLIIKKIMPEGLQENMTELIRQQLPALHLDEFYAQLYRQEQQAAFIALCRKTLVDEMMGDLKSAKYEIADVLLGVPGLIGLEPLWSSFSTLCTSTHRAELSNNALDGLIPVDPGTEETIRIEGLEFCSLYTLGLAAGLPYLMRRTLGEHHSENIRVIRQKHVERNKFRFLMVSVVTLAFLLAVVNVVFYTSFFDRNNRLETELSVYQGKYEQISKLLNDYQENKNLIENAGMLEGNKLSEYADRIGKTIPEDVLLSELYFNPRKEEEESGDSLVTFENRQLVLKGNCIKSFIVNEWINVLKMQGFVRNVSLERFVYQNQGLQPNFEIRLTTE